MVSKCFHCNGFYGPSFDQPVCAVCHQFLYANESSLQSTYSHFHDKVDDGDSGNEEPKEPSEYQAHTSSNAYQNPSDNFSEDEYQAEEPPGSPPIEALPRMAYEEVETVPELEAQSTTSDVSADWLDTNDDDLSETVIQKIPPEVLLLVFQMLDEITLWSVSQVCRHWNQLVKINFNDKWKLFTQRRWPLFNAIYNVTNWYKVFTNLIESAPCQRCLLQLSYNATLYDNENSWRRNRLCGELRTLRSDPPEGITASPLDENALQWQASIIGPQGSPYQGGTFFFYIQIPPNYPLKPPLVRFTTKIFHPNVSRHGDIGIDSIQHNWSLALTISKILISIQSLLTDPYTKVCMEKQIGDMYENNRPLFDKIARAWTWRYAMHDALQSDSIMPHYLQTIMAESSSMKNLDELVC